MLTIINVGITLCWRHVETPSGSVRMKMQMNGPNGFWSRLAYAVQGAKIEAIPFEYGGNEDQ